MTAFFAVPVVDFPKYKDGTSALTLRYVSKFICKRFRYFATPTSLTNASVSLSVAIILPFLIIAFTVNGIRKRIRAWKRELRYPTVASLEKQSRWQKFIARVNFVTRPLWHPLYSFLDDLGFWEYILDILLATFKLLRKGVAALSKREKRNVPNDPLAALEAGKES
jgi:hypothetical protein